MGVHLHNSTHKLWRKFWVYITMKCTRILNAFVICRIIRDVCFVQDCPKDTVDFRESQCKAFDNRAYMGKVYSWESFIDGKTFKTCSLVNKSNSTASFSFPDESNVNSDRYCCHRVALIKNTYMPIWFLNATNEYKFHTAYLTVTELPVWTKISYVYAFLPTSTATMNKK